MIIYTYIYIYVICVAKPLLNTTAKKQKNKAILFLFSCQIFKWHFKHVLLTGVPYSLLYSLRNIVKILYFPPFFFFFCILSLQNVSFCLIEYFGGGGGVTIFFLHCAYFAFFTFQYSVYTWNRSRVEFVCVLTCINELTNINICTIDIDKCFSKVICSYITIIYYLFNHKCDERKLPLLLLHWIYFFDINLLQYWVKMIYTIYWFVQIIRLVVYIWSILWCLVIIKVIRKGIYCTKTKNQ